MTTKKGIGERLVVLAANRVRYRMFVSKNAFLVSKSFEELREDFEWASKNLEEGKKEAP